MEEINKYFQEAKAPPKLINGSAGKWYNNILGQEFNCSCGDSFIIEKENIGLSTGGGLPSKMDKLKHEILGQNAYNVSDETVKNGLFTEDGMLVQGLVKCPYCLHQHGHHTEHLQKQGPIFQPPTSKYAELTSQ
jgi:hypothetical protein